MKIKAKVVVAASLLLAGLFGIWYVTSPPASLPGVSQRTASGMTGTAPVRLDQTDSPESPERMAVEAAVAEAEIASAASLLVRVTWQDTGEPAAHVGLHVAVGGWGEPGTLASTGEDGTARFEGLEPGNHTVNLDRRTEISPRKAEIELAAGEQGTVEIEVAPGLNVRGVVVDPDGIPVANAEILIAWGGVSPQWTFPTARTDGQGTFFLRSLGDHNLIGARAEGLGTSDFSLLQTAGRGSPGEVVIRLVLPGSSAEITGTVYDPEGNPVAGAWVGVGAMSGMRVLPNGSSGQKPPRVIQRTDGQGSFRVGSLQPGRHQVLVYGQGFVAWNEDVNCPPGETTSVTIQLQRGAALFGQITDLEGRPLENVWVTVPNTHHPTRAGAQSDMDRDQVAARRWTGNALGRGVGTGSTDRRDPGGCIGQAPGGMVVAERVQWRSHLRRGRPVRLRQL
jgi:protocatechuate 3,4-dioxygenase beta subunit